MTTERVTIQVESNIGEDGPLTVMDTLDQFKDAFELLSAAIAQEAGGEMSVVRTFGTGCSLD